MGERKERITENGIDYMLVGDYYVPDLKLPEENRSIGYFGRLHRDYLKQEHSARYTAILLTCELWTYLADLNEQAEETVRYYHGADESCRRSDRGTKSQKSVGMDSGNEQYSVSGRGNSKK